MKLTYWIAMPLHVPSYDIPAMTIRAKTKKAVLAEIELRKISNCGAKNTWEKPRKVTAIYDDAFDLVLQCVENNTFASFE